MLSLAEDRQPLAQHFFLLQGIELERGMYPQSWTQGAFHKPQGWWNIYWPDEIYTGHLRTCMPSWRSYLILPPHVVLTCVLKLPVCLLPQLAVLTCILPPLVFCIYCIVDHFLPLFSQLPHVVPLAMLTCVLPPLVPLLLLLVVLTRILPPLGFHVKHVVNCFLPLFSHDWHVLIFDYQHFLRNVIL